MIRVVPNVECRLGEGLLWDPDAHRLLMTDIVAQRLLQVDIDRGGCVAWPMPENIGWVLPARSPGRYAVGLASGIAVFDTREPDELHWLERTFPGDTRSRLNDACTDRAGRIWYGSMHAHDGAGSIGCLASYAADSGTTIHDGGFGVTNGPVISPDDRFLFVNDTLQGIVYRYDFDLRRGRAEARVEFLRFDPVDGYPDGMCFDADGHLWVAMWGGGRVVQVGADARVLRRFDIPAPNVTNVCFCGPALDRLVVSSATLEMSDAERARHPSAGCLFEIGDHGTRGSACPRSCID